MKLTAKEERLCQEYASGKTQIEAYRLAYPNNMTDKQRHEEACKKFKTPKILQRVAELKEKTAKKHELTRDWLIEQAKEVLIDSRVRAENGNAVQALKLLQSLGGFDKQTVEHQGSVTVMNRVIIDGEALDFGLSNNGED